MSVRVAINGFGRIGRQLLRLGLRKKTVEFVAINDLSPVDTRVHLLKYDSVHRTFAKIMEISNSHLIVEGQKISMLTSANIQDLSWKDLKVDIVLECTGRMTNRELASQHIKSGAKKVIVSAPCKNEDLTVIMGINEPMYDPKTHHVISNASCTTNCLGIITKVIKDAFGIEKAFMSTIHSYTNDQRVLDLAHKDLRRARAAGLSIIPTTSGATDTLIKVFPELKDKFDGLSVRVPTPNVSLIDIVFVTEKPTSVVEVNSILEKASKKDLKNYIGYCTEPLVSSDFIGDERSAVIDASLTQVIGGNMVKVIAWYDNEVAFSLRMLELAEYMHAKGY